MRIFATSAWPVVKSIFENVAYGIRINGMARDRGDLATALGLGKKALTVMQRGVGPHQQEPPAPVEVDLEPVTDGRRIAIASDRDGLWNIWTLDLEGKDAKQISRERRWFVNSPAWSPDGEYIYARRHFVKERSLGAGEIWMFHASGASEGLQVTERTGWQKDNGEPAISLGPAIVVGIGVLLLAGTLEWTDEDLFGPALLIVIGLVVLAGLWHRRTAESGNRVVMFGGTKIKERSEHFAHSDVSAIFGGATGGVSPLDAELALPARCYSDLLRD